MRSISPRVDRLVLAVEVVFGVVPVTVIGGFYALLGMYFAVVAVVMSMWHLAAGALAFWLGVFALAAGGFAGIIGMWAVVLISASVRPSSPRLTRNAVVGSAIGVVAALVGLTLLLRDSAAPSRLVLATLAAPIVVAVHRVPAIARTTPRELDGRPSAGSSFDGR